MPNIEHCLDQLHFEMGKNIWGSTMCISHPVCWLLCLPVGQPTLKIELHPVNFDICWCFPAREREVLILYTMSRALLILTLLKAWILSPAGPSGDDQCWLRVKGILLALSGLAAAGFGSGPWKRQAMMVIQRARLVFSCSAVSLAGTGEMGLNKSSVQSAEDWVVLRNRCDNKGCNNEEGILL